MVIAKMEVASENAGVSAIAPDEIEALVNARISERMRKISLASWSGRDAKARRRRLLKAWRTRRRRNKQAESDSGAARELAGVL